LAIIFIGIFACGYFLGKNHKTIEYITKEVEVIKYVTKEKSTIYSAPNINRDTALLLFDEGVL